MKVYLDTSVCHVFLFGVEKEAKRFEHVMGLFERINAAEIEAVTSLYTLQELCMYCYQNFPIEMAGDVARLAVRDLLNNRVALAPLLTRTERLIHRRRFTLRDASDESHVIVGLLQNCQAIVAYDERFRDSAEVLPYFRPEDVLTLPEGQDKSTPLAYH